MPFFCHFDLNEFFYWTEVDSSQEFLFKKINLLFFLFVCFTLLLSCVSSLRFSNPLLDAWFPNIIYHSGWLSFISFMVS